MTDREKAVKAIDNFLRSDRQILLLKGYDNRFKIHSAFSCVNNYFKSGILRVTNMEYAPDIINDAFKNDIIPRTLNSTKKYKVGQMSIQISSYATSTRSNFRGDQNTFTIYCPVQLVLDDSKRYSKFIEEIKNCQSRKIILITTNEWGIENWDIENHVDEVFFYSVENDNPEIMENLRNNGAI